MVLLIPLRIYSALVDLDSARSGEPSQVYRCGNHGDSLSVIVVPVARHPRVSVVSDDASRSLA